MPRLRTVSENVLGAAAQRINAQQQQHGQHLEPGSWGSHSSRFLEPLRSSWEGHKQHYGHVRASPSPNRQCSSMAVTAATTRMQTHRVTKQMGALSMQVDQQNKTFKTIEEFVEYFTNSETPAKKRSIKKILVATNGIAAVKCIDSMRKMLQLAFGNDRIIKFICMTTEQEVQSQAEYLKKADYPVFSPAGANTNNYANVDEIVGHAVRQEVDAVWAGWGHASENPRLPEELHRAGIVFIGPPAKAMFALGDKIASTIIAQTVGIPTIEWSGSGLIATEPVEDPNNPDAEELIPEDLYHRACVTTVEEGLEALHEKNITYPIMIKASEGGGGKGIRRCNNDDEFRINFRRVQAEVPGSPIFLMKCMENARHIEVQLIADQYGNVIPLYTRDCSIQRRCQKIIEEAPAGIAPRDVLANMQRDAVALAKKVGYVSAGTVEYMYLPASQEYFFLELNPRLQVEHPCTEMISNINIPAVQLQIAMGVPLHRIVDLRLFYGLERYGTDGLPANAESKTDSTCCVIAARITSEDPAEGFRPASGTVEWLQFHSSQNVWGYFSVASSGKVHEYADSQFGHLFAKGTTRHEAISALTCALKELELRATFTSQVNYLVGLLHDPDFEQNRFHTGWLDARIAANVQSAPVLPIHVTIAIGATVIGHARITEVFSKYQNAIERGQILSPKELTETWEVELAHNGCKYSVLVNRYGPINFMVCLNENKIATELRELGNGTLLVTYSDQAYTCYLEEEPERFKVSIGKTLTIFEKENDPSVLRSPNAGKLLAYLKKDGERVSVGETYAEMESMKMVVTLQVKKAGGKLVTVAQPGQVLFPGTLIARLEDQNDGASAKPVDFAGTIEEWHAATERQQRAAAAQRVNLKFGALLQSCNDVLSGYAVPEPFFKDYVQKLVDDLFEVLNDKELPYALFKVMFNVVVNRINKVATTKKINALLQPSGAFPASELTDVMEEYLSGLNPAEVGVEKQYFEGLLKICERFQDGLEGHKKLVVDDLLTTFLGTERYFQEEVPYDKGVAAMKAQVSDAQQIVRMVYSHTRVLSKNTLMIEVLGRLDHSLVVSLQPTFKKIANLSNKETERLAIYVRKIINGMHQINYEEVCTNLSRKSSQRSLSDLVKLCSENGGDTLLRGFDSENPLVLHEFFFTPNKETNFYAIRTFIRRTFYVEDTNIEVVSTKAKYHIFKFQITSDSPLYAHAVRGAIHEQGKVFYFLSVLSELDLLRHKDVVNVLAENAEEKARNNFLFISYSTGQNGFSTAMTMEDGKLRDLGRKLRDEIGSLLEKANAIKGRDATDAVDLMLSRPSKPPLYTGFDFSMKEKLELYRLPAEAEQIELPKSPFLLYKHNDRGVQRIFVRCLLRDVASVLRVEKYSSVKPLDLLREKIVEVIDGACGEIRVCTAADKTRAVYSFHHMLICLDYEPELNSKEWHVAIQDAVRQCGKQLTKHRVVKMEVTYQARTPNQTSLETIRVMYFNETGAIPDLSAYRVVNSRLQPLNEEHKLFKDKDCYEAHWPIANVQVQKKRYQAHKLNTTYVYDFPIVFGRAALDLWKQYQQTDPKSFAKAIEKLSADRRTALAANDPKHFAVACEMILDDNADRFYVCRDKEELRRRAENGANDRGMLAWEIEICTPDAIEGRKIVVIANDITYALGSFSMREHNMYQQASEYSRKHRMPRVYLAANSGARIGFASEIKQRLNVAWNDDARPEDGFRYLCVDCEGPSDPVLGQILSSEDENGRRRLDAVIGKEDDIGVENLVGSGLIAGETSAAYREVPTYCLVTGRAVGIGAYAARLAHRICQVETSDIILTGAPALNSLLGREIYTSNSQLGGPQIMFNNGVSHSVVQTDLEGVRTVLKWISYVPQEGELVPRPMLKDDQARPVETQPTKAAYDPRMVLDPPEGGGLFDRGTFDEVMSGWAKTIIAGRARLRGLPVGVVAVETRTVESEVPADPAAQDSQSRLVQQAGQVWYPDSAYKTAEAINDFNREGLPLIFIANIRGFSGGQKDMFEMVLKFGACIVDALQSYTQPVIVYIPPYGELRGGAWAVLDTKINSTCITMLADPDSRGGVLEPEGIVEIKFRKGDLHALMSKCDAKLQRLESSLKAETLSTEERKTLQLAADKRREFLMPVYRTAAVKFADLHDTTARMIAKGAIHDEVSWRESRNYFYDLFSVQLAKFSMARQYLQASGVDLAHLRIDELTRGCQWVEEHLARLAQSITYQRTVSTDLAASRRRYEYVAEKIDEYAQGTEFRRVTDGIEQQRVTNAFSEVLKKLDATQQRSLLAKLTAQLSTPSAERH